jgi:hypothetical protein
MSMNRPIKQPSVPQHGSTMARSLHSIFFPEQSPTRNSGASEMVSKKMRNTWKRML